MLLSSRALLPVQHLGAARRSSLLPRHLPRAAAMASATAAGGQKEVVRTDKAPAAVGPYSQAVKCKGMLYASGSIGLHPQTMKLVGDGVEEQAEQVMCNLEAILVAAGCAWPDVVKTTILLTSIADFGAVNQIYAKRFPVDPPARATFAVAALPLGAKVEIELIASLP